MAAISQFASVLELSLLSPIFTEEETLAGCTFAVQNSLAAVVVKPCFVRQAVNALRGTAVPVGTVIGFPYGSAATQVKLQETKRALTEGALGVEMALNLGYLRAGQQDPVRADLQAICGLAHMNGAQMGVVVELAWLTPEEAALACRLAVEVGVDWVAGATGFGLGSSTPEAITRLRGMLGDSMGVKAVAVGDSLGAVTALMAAGASRVAIPEPGLLLADEG